MSKHWLLAAALGAIATGTAMAATEQLTPGTVLTKAEIAQAKPWLSPGVEWCLRNGMKIEVGATEPVHPPREYLEATEKYASQTRLSADGRSVENYVAGLPFPIIDPNDAQAGSKVMWNFEYSWFYTDDVSLDNFAATTGAVDEHGAVSLERLIVMSHYKRLKYTGRLFVDPKPTWKTSDNRRYAEILSPVIEPYDLKGVGTLYYRYNNPDQSDDTFTYLPSLRRVRRYSTTERSLGQFGTDFDIDSYAAYSGQISWTDWKYLGEREVLVPVHTRDYPPSMPLERFAPDDLWEKRKVHVVEGTSRLPQYAYSKRTLYVDKEFWRSPIEDIYDHRGQLWKVLIDFFSFRPKAFEGAKLASYGYDAGFMPYEIIVDVQAHHSSSSIQPLASRYQGEEGW